jgi:adenylate cyclase
MCSGDNHSVQRPATVGRSRACLQIGSNAADDIAAFPTGDAMTDTGTPLGRWFAELRRRKVFRVAAVYVVLAWLTIQVADATFAPLGLPASALKLVIVLVALGFPIACGLAWAFDLGPQGIVRTPDVPAVSAAQGGATTQALPTRVHANPATSVAILPFLDLSPAHDQEYFCDGIAEEIINSLCCVTGLRVASRTSSFQYRGRQVDVREIGQALGVGAVLEGSVRKAADRVRIAAQLVSCADGYHHWSESFDRKLDDVFEIQSEIARQLVRALKLTLSPQETALLGRGGTTNAEAYDLYLRGQADVRDGTDLTLPRAALLFRQAIERDPGFAQAHAGLANALALKGSWRLDMTPQEFEEAFRASQRALDLQPQMPEAYLASACLLSMQDRTEEAERAFEAALRLNPASYDAHHMYARHLFSAGRYERAAQHFETAHRLQPDEYQCVTMLQGPLERLGRIDEARATGQRAMVALEARLGIEPTDGRALHLAAVQAAKGGDRARMDDYAARAMLARPGEFATAYNLACAYCVLGELDRALQLLDSAVRHGRGNLGWIEHDADLDNLRGDPRFEAIVARLRPGTPGPAGARA